MKYCMRSLLGKVHLMEITDSPPYVKKTEVLVDLEQYTKLDHARDCYETLNNASGDEKHRLLATKLVSMSQKAPHGTELVLEDGWSWGGRNMTERKVVAVFYASK